MIRTHAHRGHTMSFSEALLAFLIKYGLFIASLVGSILSLSLLRPLTRQQAAWAVATGFFTAIFTTDLVVAYFGLPASGDARNGVAYLIGLFAMNLIPLGKKIIEAIARNHMKGAG